MPKIDKNRRSFKRRRTTYFNGFNMRWRVLAGVFVKINYCTGCAGRVQLCQNADARYMGYAKQLCLKNKKAETCLNNG